MEDEKKQDDDKKSAEKKRPVEKKEAPAGRLSASEIADRLSKLEVPKPDVPIWAPPRAEDLVYAEVGPRFRATDDVTRRSVGPGERGHFHRELLERHPEGFLEVGDDGKTKGRFPELKTSSRLVTGPAVHTPEPLIPRPIEGAPAA